MQTLAHALFLFYTTGNSKAVDLVQETVERALGILQKGPDGNTKFNIGNACVCWSCGHVGIPKNSASLSDGAIVSYDTLPCCKNCSSDVETNFVIGQQPDGTVLPWIEVDLPVEFAEDA